MYDFEQLLKATICDKMQVYRQMEDQTKRAVSIVSASESGPNSEFGPIVCDMMSHYSQYIDFMKTANQQIHLSVQMYLYLAKFCQLNKIYHVADIGCGWNPIQSFYFSNYNIDYIGVDTPSTQSTLVQMLNNPYNDHVRYISSEYPYTDIDFPKDDISLGMFLYSMNNLVDNRKYPMVDKEQIADTQLAICCDFDIVAFTVFDGFNEDVFQESRMAKTHTILHISKPFEFLDDFSGKDTKIVMLKKRNTDLDINSIITEFPEETCWVENENNGGNNENGK